MKKYLMLSAFIVFSVSQVTFANPELEGDWKGLGMACVDFDNKVVLSPVSKDVLPKDSASYIKFTSDNNTTGNFDIMAVQAVPTYSYDLNSGEATEVIELNIESCNINGTYSTSGNSISVTVDILSAWGSCDSGNEGVVQLGSSGVTLSLSVGGVDYFVESDRLYVPSFDDVMGTGSYSYEDVVNLSIDDSLSVPEEGFVDEPEVDTDLDCGENSQPAIVWEKM